MLRRVRTLASGKRWVSYYYYNGRDDALAERIFRFLEWRTRHLERHERRTSVGDTRSRLRQLIDEKFLKVSSSPIRLSTGALSYFYFDCKAVTLDGEALSLIADEFLQEIQLLPEMPIAIGGLTMGADFITAVVAMRAFERGLQTVHGSVVRKEPKKHGTMNHIENELPEGTPIVVVDDVITTGNSTRIACEQFLAAGYKIVGIIALVDREQGGRQALEQQFGVVRSVFRKSDFPRIADNEQQSTDHIATARAA